MRALAPTSSRELFPACGFRRRPRAPPSHLPARTSRPRIVSPPCDSAGRVCLQPAADLRHVQGHEHGRDVLRALAARGLAPRALNRPCTLALQPLAPQPPLRPLLPPTPSHLPARTSPRILCALLSTRQQAYAFNQPLSFDTSSVTNMNSMFYVRSAREPWPPIFSCSPPRVCLRRLPRRCPTTLPIPVPHAPHPA